MDTSKKDEILIACLAEFAQYGYEKANTNRICNAAGVSKGLLFHYFGTKKALYFQCVEHCIDDMLKIFEENPVKEQDFYSMISAYGEAKFHFFAKHPFHYRLLISAFFNAPKELHPELAKRYSELNEYSTQAINGLIQKLKLKPGVTIQQSMTMMGAVISAIEKKYIPVVISSPECDEELFRRVEREFLQMLNLLLYGIAEPPEA